MNKLVVICFIFIAVSVHAASVKHYTPDEPLIPTVEGLNKKVDDLCLRSQGDISGYVENEFEYQKFIQQFEDTKKTIRQNQEILPSEKSSLTQSIISCKQTMEKRIYDIRQMKYKLDNMRQTLERLEEQKNEIKVSGINSRIMRYDSIGNTYFSIKADVFNSGEPKSVRVWLQAIDSDGYELKTVILEGFVEKRKTVTLSDQTLLETPAYNKIKEWKLLGIK